MDHFILPIYAFVLAFMLSVEAPATEAAAKTCDEHTTPVPGTS